MFELDSNIKLISSLPIESRILLFGTQIKNIRKVLKGEKPSIIISFMAPTNIMTILGSLFLKIPVVLSEHTHFYRAVNGKIWKILRRILYPFSDQLILLTETDKKNYNFIEHPMVLPNPLILKHKHQNIKRENIILGVGRVHEVKGFDMLIQAFIQLDLKNWKLIIAGDKTSEYYGTLKRQLEKSKTNNNIQFVGLIQDIELYYKKASIYVLSSRSEGFPGTLCEAMGYGCPSIAFNCQTGPSDIIEDDVNGLLVQANNVDELSKKILYLIESKEKRNLLSKNSLNIIKKLDINYIGQQWEELLLSTVKKYR